MLLRFVALLCCLCACLSISVAAPPLPATPPSPPRSEKEVFSIVREMLDDSLFAPNVQIGAVTKRNESEFGQSTNYSLLFQDKPLDPASFYVIERFDKSFDFRLQLGDFYDVSTPPIARVARSNWENSLPLYDHFVSSRWPGAKRLTTWQRAMDHVGSWDVVTLAYAVTEQEAELVRLHLEVRLTDGKLNGLSASFPARNLQGRAVPSMPSEERVLDAFRRAIRLPQNKGFAISSMRLRVVDVNVTGLSVTEILSTRRDVDSDWGKSAPFFSQAVTLRGTDGNGVPVQLGGTYIESNEQAIIEWVYKESDLPEHLRSTSK